jgi:hypothetical protein
MIVKLSSRQVLELFRCFAACRNAAHPQIAWTRPVTHNFPVICSRFEAQELAPQVLYRSRPLEVSKDDFGEVLQEGYSNRAGGCGGSGDGDTNERVGWRLESSQPGSPSCVAGSPPELV